MPADCILIEEMNINVDETSYGNTKSVEKEPSAVLEYDEDNADQQPDNHKDNPDNILLTGTMIMSGGGKAVVCCVGTNTHLGRLGKR